MHDIVVSRFLVFGGPGYYATGGFNDFIASFATLDDALRFANDPVFDETVRKWRYMSRADWDWWHIFDADSMSIVAQSKIQAYGHEGDDPIIHDCSAS